MSFGYMLKDSKIKKIFKRPHEDTQYLPTLRLVIFRLCFIYFLVNTVERNSLNILHCKSTSEFILEKNLINVIILNASKLLLR